MFYSWLPIVTPRLLPKLAFRAGIVTRKKPSLRVWRGYDFPSFLRYNPSIATSFGLVDSSAQETTLALNISRILAGIAQSTYSAYLFEGNNVSALECGAALSELLVHRLNDVEQFGRFVSGAKVTEALEYDWLEVDGNTDHWEEVSLRAIVTCVRHFTQCEHIHLIASQNEILFDVQNAQLPCGLENNGSMIEIFTWTRCEMFPRTNTDEPFRIVQRD